MAKNRIIVYDFTWDDDREFGVWIGHEGEPEILVECMVVYYDFDTVDELDDAYSSFIAQDEPHEDDSPRQFGDSDLADYLLVGDFKLGPNDFVIMDVKGQSKYLEIPVKERAPGVPDRLSRDVRRRQRKRAKKR